MPIIHVIIPCYNVEKYLEQAVRSVLDQPCTDIDIVLIDDGSPGETPQLCDRLAENEPRIHVVHKQNGGLSDARNAGIEYALSHLVKNEREFLGFLDGDDAWCPGVIDHELVQHLQFDWSEDVIGFSGVLSNNAMTRFGRKSPKLEVAQAPAKDLIWKAQRAHLCAKLYAVRMFRQWDVRFQYKQLYTEDRIFVVQFFFLAATARFVNRTLHIYRKNNAGIMGQLRKKSAVEHYLPIIDGWIKSDGYLNSKKSLTGETAHMGYTLAASYLVDMAAEHFMKGGKREEILFAVRSHPHYSYVLHPEKQYHTAKSYRTNRLFITHPHWFEVKYRLFGIFKKMQWRLLRVPVMGQLWEIVRYPHRKIPR